MELWMTDLMRWELWMDGWINLGILAVVFSPIWLGRRAIREQANKLTGDRHVVEGGARDGRR